MITEVREFWMTLAKIKHLLQGNINMTYFLWLLFQLYNNNIKGLLTNY